MMLMLLFATKSQRAAFTPLLEINVMICFLFLNQFRTQYCLYVHFIYWFAVFSKVLTKAR